MSVEMRSPRPLTSGHNAGENLTAVVAHQGYMRLARVQSQFRIGKSGIQVVGHYGRRVAVVATLKNSHASADVAKPGGPWVAENGKGPNGLRRPLVQRLDD